MARETPTAAQKLAITTAMEFHDNGTWEAVTAIDIDQSVHIVFMDNDHMNEVQIIAGKIDEDIKALCYMGRVFLPKTN